MKLITLTVFAALVACGSCTDKADRSDKPEGGGSSVTHVTEPNDAIDQKLMVALSQAKNFHHKAKVYMTDGDLPDAIEAVRSILAIQFPAGAPEAEDVRLDADALLAKLLLAQGKSDEAMKVVEQGIASRTRDSFFLANLYTVAGEVHEARAADLEGDAAKAEKKAAIEAYDHSLQIDETLQKQLVGEPTP